MKQIDLNFKFLNGSLPFQFNAQILNVQNPSNLKIVFETNDTDSQQILQSSKQISLKGYKQIGMKNIQLLFNLSSNAAEDASTCGLSLTDVVDLIYLDNLEMVQDLPAGWKLYCKTFSFKNNNKVIVNNFTLTNETMTLDTVPTIVYSDSNQVVILSQFNVSQNEFVKLLLVKSVGQSKVIINQMFIENNEFVPPGAALNNFNLFEFASSISVHNLRIAGNVFRKLNIFYFSASDIYDDQVFSFKGVVVHNNTFYDYLNGLFLNIEYPQVQTLDHHLLIEDYQQSNNSLVNVQTGNISLYTLLYFTKIELIEIKSVLVNEESFIYGVLRAEYSGNITLSGVEICNHNNFASMENLTPPIIKIDNYMNAVLDRLKLHRLISKSQPLVVMVITDPQQAEHISNCTVQNSLFTNIILKTSTMFESTTILHEETPYTLNSWVKNSTFRNISLNVGQFGNVQSSSALIVQAINSNISIEGSVFSEGVTNNNINFIYALSSNLSVSTSIFELSNYLPIFEQSQINVEGGFMNLKITNVDIRHSAFSNSQAAFGAVGYIESISGKLSVKIHNSTFTNLFSYGDGSLLYIDRKQNQMAMEIVDSHF